LTNCLSCMKIQNITSDKTRDDTTSDTSTQTLIHSFKKIEEKILKLFTNETKS
jgi:hypothetical protein